MVVRGLLHLNSRVLGLGSYLNESQDLQEIHQILLGILGIGNKDLGACR